MHKLKGYGRVTKDVMRDPNISLIDKAIYAYLCTFADNETDELFVGVKTIANECNVSESTVKRSLISLQKHGVIKRTSREFGKTILTTILK